LIREAKLSDLNEIVEIENQNYSCPWSYEAFLSELNSDTTTIYVYEKDNIVVGYVVVYDLFGEADIANIAVKKEYQRRKIGFELMRFVVSKYTGYTIYLEVREDNIRAINLYKKFGFFVYGRRKDYYEKGIDAFLMKLNNLGVNYA